MKRTAFWAAACAAAIVLGAAGASNGQDMTKITLNSQANEAGFPLWLANELGYFKERGLEVEIEYFANGGAALLGQIHAEFEAVALKAEPRVELVHFRPRRAARCDQLVAASFARGRDHFLDERGAEAGASP